jgi:flagellar biosynthesis protein FliR
VNVQELAATVIGEAARGSALAIRLSFPVMAAVLFGYVAVGVIGRSAPQMNLANIGYAVALLAGGAALYLVSPTLAEIVARSARSVFIGT